MKKVCGSCARPFSSVLGLKEGDAMKLIFILLLAIIIPLCALAQSYKCVAPDGTVYEAKYPCDPERVERFVSRFDLLRRKAEYMIKV